MPFFVEILKMNGKKRQGGVCISESDNQITLKLAWAL